MRIDINLKIHCCEFVFDINFTKCSYFQFRLHVKTVILVASINMTSRTIVLRPEGFSTFNDDSTNQSIILMSNAYAQGVNSWKPKQWKHRTRISLEPNIYDCVWTQRRDILPAEFRYTPVSLDLWKEAWDIVFKQVHSELRLRREIMQAAHSHSKRARSCLVCCCGAKQPSRLKRIGGLQRQIETEWYQVAKAIYQMFEGFDVRVRLAQDTLYTGIQFEIYKPLYDTRIGQQSIGSRYKYTKRSQMKYPYTQPHRNIQFKNNLR